MDDLWPIGYQLEESQSVSSPSDQFEPHDTPFGYLDPHFASSSWNSLHLYDQSIRMDTLTNEALLLMVHEWQQVIYYGEEHYAVHHPHFQHTMKELENRGLLDANWTWLVDVEEVDMVLTRTTL